MVKRLSKIVSVILILVVFVSNIATISYAAVDNNFKLYETDINEIVEDLRDAMTDRDERIVIKYATKTEYNSDNFGDFINNLYALALNETDESDEGDYLRYIVTDFGTDNTDVRKIGSMYYYDIPLYIKYYTTRSQEKIVEDSVKKIIKGFNFNKDTTDKEKCDKIYRYITANIKYDYANLNDDSYTLKYTAYAALVNKTAVCQGYATLFYRMAKECGLNVRVISGTSRGDGHAWNIVKLDGMYYYLDSTWDAGTNIYKYYLKGSNDFGDHICDTVFETAEFKQQYPIDIDNYGEAHAYEKIYEDNFCIKYACKDCNNERTESKLPLGETLAQDTDGTWYYFVDGVKNSASTLLQYDGKLCYIKSGIWEKNSNVVVLYDNKYYYIKNGVWDESYTKIVKCDGKNIYIKNGLWQISETGFIEYDGQEYYINDGVWTKSTSFIKCGGKYYYVKDGIKTATTGFVKYDGEYRYVVDGVWNKVTDFIKYKNREYYVKSGVRSTATGFVKFDGEYYKINKGIRSSTVTYKKCGNAYLRLSVTEYTYSGKAKKPSVKVYDSNGNTLSSGYYKVTYAEGRKNVGKYKVTVKFMKKYSGTQKLYFTIIPDDTSISKLSAANKSLKVTVKKKSKQVTGYQIQYSTSKTFSSASTKTVSSYKTTAVTLTGLKSKTTYYVRVRTYKKVNGKKYYSEWSKAVKKKTK